MNTTAAKDNRFNSFFPRIKMRRGLLFGVIILAALLAFEFFNYSTTVFALRDLMGELEFLGIEWAIILAIAFCGIDFAGIARLFTPEVGNNEPNEVWYLFAAWMLAATMNALLTWWGVSIPILNHQSQGDAVVSNQMLLKVVPIFVAVMVWLIRVLIIGTISVSGDRLFSQADQRAYPGQRTAIPARTLGNSASLPLSKPQAAASAAFKPSPKPSAIAESSYAMPEPTYHPLSMNARPPRSSTPHTKS
jgi:hypothetical protein